MISLWLCDKSVIRVNETFLPIYVDEGKDKVERTKTGRRRGGAPFMLRVRLSRARMRVT